MISLTSPPSSSSSRKFKHLALAEVCLSTTPHTHTHTTLHFPHMRVRVLNALHPSPSLPRYLLQNASPLCHRFRLALPRPLHHMDLPLQLFHESILHRQQHLHLISHESPFPVRPPPPPLPVPPFPSPRLRTKVDHPHSTLHTAQQANA